MSNIKTINTANKLGPLKPVSTPCDFCGKMLDPPDCPECGIEYHAEPEGNCETCKTTFRETEVCFCHDTPCYPDDYLEEY